jgi:hypothetical protein
LPVEVGVKKTRRVQLAPEARPEPQVLVSPRLAFAAIPAIVSSVAARNYYRDLMSDSRNPAGSKGTTRPKWDFPCPFLKSPVHFTIL